MSNGLTSALAGKNILITGVSGFLGKVVLEKLLRSVPDVQRIHLIIRANQNFHTAEERFYNEIINSSIFDQLRSRSDVDFKLFCQQKLSFITGDITQPRLGLSLESFQTLGQQLDLIINSAASVDFREPLDSALKINALSLYSIAALSRIKQVPVVQVSTCYVNGFNKGRMLENNHPPAKLNLYRHHQGYYDIEHLLEKLHKEIQAIYNLHISQEEREKLLISLGVKAAQQAGWNDSYTFTKWIGEQILLKELNNQGVSILRPAIIESTFQAPVPGWIEGVKVADAIILAYAKEKISIFPGNKHGVIDIIPADLVANSLILIAAQALKGPRAQRIYQCSSSESNPILIREMIEFVQQAAHKDYHLYENLFSRKPQKPFVMVPRLAFSGVVYGGYYYTHLKSRLSGRELSPRDKRLQRNLKTAIQLSAIFAFYTQPKYTFCNQKLRLLHERANEREQAEFPVDAAVVDWSHYLTNVHLSGLDRYALKPRQTHRAAKASEPEGEIA